MASASDAGIRPLASRREDDTLSLMGHVIADYPNATAARAMIEVMAAQGVAVVEIQIPFSEPMADGPLFLAANHAALKAGVGYEASLALMHEMSARHPQVSFVFMSYLNVLFRRGYDVFAREAAEAGARGVIVPDLPFDRAGPLEAELTRFGLSYIRLAAPNMSAARMRAMGQGARGLIYAVARRGVTGAKTELGAEVQEFLARVRATSSCPVAVGFGIRTAEDIRTLRGHADLAVVGTAALQAFEQSGLEGYAAFWHKLAQASH